MNKPGISNHLALGSAALSLSLALGGCNKSTPDESEGNRVTSSRTQTAEVLSAPSASASANIVDAGAKAEARKDQIVTGTAKEKAAAAADVLAGMAKGGNK